MIPNIGPMEILIVVAICLIIFGPRRLPELGRSAGRTLTSFRESLNGTAEPEPAQPEAAAKTAPGLAGTAEPEIEMTGIGEQRNPAA